MAKKKPKLKISANQIHRRLLHFVRCPNEIVIPNYYHGDYEMDVFRLTASEYLYEYEIKVSRGDYFADFKKGDKHLRMQNGKIANRFFFVVPRDMISIFECPAYAGLIYTDGFNFEIVKNAPQIHKVKAKVNYRDIALNQMHRLIETKHKLFLIQKDKRDANKAAKG